MSGQEGRRLRVVAHNGAHIWGGGERAVVLILAGLAARGHRVLLLCASRRVAARAREMGVPTRIVRLGGNAMLPHAVRLAALLRRLRPDVLLIGTYRKLFLAALAGRMARVPRMVVRIGLQNHAPSRFTYRWALERWVDDVVVNAAAIAPNFVGASGRRGRPPVVIPNGVAAPERTAAPGSLRATLGIPPTAPVIGAVARLAWQKRLDRLVEALAALPADTHLVLAGEGGERPRLERRAAELGVAARVHLLGHRTDVGTVLDALDVYVVSSDTEGLSNAMLEAMAFGLPVVSTAVSGAAEALAPLPDGRVPGWVVPHGAEPLAEALRPLLRDGAARLRAGAAARARAEAEYGHPRALDRWEALLGAAGER